MMERKGVTPVEKNEFSSFLMKAVTTVGAGLLGVLTYLSIEMRDDIKKLLAKDNQNDIKIEMLQKDVNRLNNKVFYEYETPPAPTRTFSFVDPGKTPREPDTYIKTPFLVPASTQYERRKFVAHKGKA